MNFFGGELTDTQKISIAAGIVVMLAASFLQTKDAVVECPSKYEYCTVNGKSYLGIPFAKKIFIAKYIKGTKVEGYSVKSGRHYRTRYMLIALDNSGLQKTLIRGYYKRAWAENDAKGLMDCLKAENYPCRVKY